MTPRRSRKDPAPKGLDSPIGRRMLRVEDEALLTGVAEFTDDVHLPRTLHVSFARSEIAHARLNAVDLTEARAAPGVVGVYCAADLALPPLVAPLENADAFNPPRPILADGRVRFVGEAVAVVVAETAYAAEDAAALVRPDFDPLPAVVDTAAAVTAAPLHDHPSNVIFDMSLDVGEVDAAFASAAAIVERTFRNPRYAATPIEPRALLAAPDGEGVRLWASTQAPHQNAEIIAEMLGLPIERVRISVTDVGGGFGQKAHTYIEHIVLPWLALELGRPVKWIEDRRENLLAASHAREQIVTVRAAADEHGRVLALESDVLCDVGAYAIWPHGHLLEPLGTFSMLPGPYHVLNYRGRSRAVASNKSPAGPYRGVGLPVSAFVHERMMDLIATELGLDPADVRRSNFVPSAAMPYTTVTHHRYDSGDYAQALDRALEAIEYDDFPERQREARAEGRLIGIGISSYVEYSGMGSAVFHARGMVGIPGDDHAWLRVGADGHVTVWTTLPAMGQGVATTFAQLTAAALGVPVETVHVERSDTAAGPEIGTGSYASRSAITGGGAIGIAGAELRTQFVEAAADRLEVSPHDLEVIEGTVRVKGSPSRGVSVAELAAAEPERFKANAAFDPPTTAYPYATHVCIVEVDPEIGSAEVLRYVIAEDCGRIINPIIVEGQAHGAVAQGVGGTLLEALFYDSEGQLTTASLMDYLVPTAVDIPAMELHHLEIPAPESPNGVKGVGEGGTLAPPGAIANAVSHALGVEMNELPLTPERVRLAAQRGRAGAAPVAEAR